MASWLRTLFLVSTRPFRGWLDSLWVARRSDHWGSVRVLAWKTQCPVFVCNFGFVVDSRYGNSFEMTKRTGDGHCKQSAKSRCF